jgi:transcriptional regulator with XRE-family HTH domain
MKGTELLNARQNGKLEQIDAAHRLGISQPYLSLLESGKRQITDRIARRAVNLFRLSPTSIPKKLNPYDTQTLSNDRIAEDLAALGFVGFAHLKKKTRRKNPADVLLMAIAKEDLDTRILEALPWLIVEYCELDWNQLLNAAKLVNLQNRLGFLTTLARKVAENTGNQTKTNLLRLKESEIEKSKLFHEEPLCNSSMTLVEKRWLKSNRTKEAKSWRLLSDLKIENLKYGLNYGK